jgi:DNA-binding transcriptional LysR family regulator
MPSVHRQTFVDFVTSHGWTRGAELGCDKGMLLRAVPNLRLTVVDTFPDRHRSRRVFDLVSEYPYLRILEGTTDAAAGDVFNGSLDFVFIDADHSYTAVKRDIAEWAPKVRDGGWLGGHDYHPRKFPGVVKAVESTSFGRPVHHLPGTIWGVWR